MTARAARLSGRPPARLAALLAGLLVFLPQLAAAADPPAWLVRAAALAAGPVDAGADASVLVDDVTVVVGRDGRATTRHLYAVRVLTRDGADAAVGRAVYNTSSGEIRAMRGWVISDGRSVQLDRDDVVDVALVDNDVYNEARARVMSGEDSMSPGAVFGVEIDSVDRTVFTQYEWMLQEEWPVRSVRRTLTLPPGWNARAVTFNHQPIADTRDGTSITWALADLTAPLQEAGGPPASSVIPRLAVSYFPEGPAANAFADWGAVSSWLDTLGAPQAARTPGFDARAREIAGTAATDLDRIHAIARYVQRVQYISIQTGIGRGGGYTPRAAVDVLAKNYGDCKDKANLMRALLATFGIRAHLVAVYAGDPDYVRDEWPSPQQFNHAIVAISVPSGTPGAAVTSHASGPLLFFDPTDEYTPPGQLPLHLQGSAGLLVMPNGGGLVRLPLSTPDANPRRRRVEASLSTTGVLNATMLLESMGEPATDERALYRALPPDRYQAALESDVRRQMPGARVALGGVTDDPVTNRFDIRLTIEAPQYAQFVQQLIVVRPPPLSRDAVPSLAGTSRRTPFLLDAHEEHDHLELTLPPGFVVDELPESQTIERPFGRLTLRWQQANGRVVRDFSLQLRRTRVPPEGYDDLRAFIAALHEAEQQPMVLVKR